jgi:hypothetical protein
VSAKKSQQRISDWFGEESYFGAESREEIVKDLGLRIERFCERASSEEIQEAMRVVRSLLAARGLLPEQASKKIN